MKTILHIDTSGTFAQILLSRNGQLLSSIQLQESKDQAGKINGMIDLALQEAQCSMQEIQAISVCNGPGSYTGLRVGLATAKGLAMALDLPLILHHKLILIAHAYAEDWNNFCVIQEARSGEYFVCAFRQKKCILQPRHFTLDDLIVYLDQEKIENLIIDKESIKEMIREENKYNFYIENRGIVAEIWIKQSEERLENKIFDDLAYSEPFYLKPAFVIPPKK